MWQLRTTCVPKLGDEAHWQRMDVDDDGDSDDDDIITGPFILNIGIAGLPFSKIFIRADYIRVYDFLNRLSSRANPVTVS